MHVPRKYTKCLLVVILLQLESCVLEQFNLNGFLIERKIKLQVENKNNLD